MSRHGCLPNPIGYANVTIYRMYHVSIIFTTAVLTKPILIEFFGKGENFDENVGVFLKKFIKWGLFSISKLM